MLVLIFDGAFNSKQTRFVDVQRSLLDFRPDCLMMPSSSKEMFSPYLRHSLLDVRSVVLIRLSNRWQRSSKSSMLVLIFDGAFNSKQSKLVNARHSLFNVGSDFWMMPSNRKEMLSLYARHSLLDVLYDCLNMLANRWKRCSWTYDCRYSM